MRNEDGEVVEKGEGELYVGSSHLLILRMGVYELSWYINLQFVIFNLC